MGTNNLAETIIALETTALEAWLKGDPTPYLELYAKDFTYFDQVHEKRIDGWDKIKELYDSLRGQINDISYKIINPIVQATDNMAVLTYNLETYGETSCKEQCTEVYRREANGAWKIIHSHWSIC